MKNNLNILIFFLYYLLINNFAVSKNLKEALELAYQNSDVVKIKDYQKDLSKVDSYKSFANFLPSVSATYSFIPTSKSKSKMNFDNSEFDNISRIAPATDFEQLIFNTLSSMSNKPMKYKKTHTLMVDATASLSYYKTIPSFLASRNNFYANVYGYDKFLEDFGLLFIQNYMDIIYYTEAQKVYKKMTELYEKKLKKVKIMNEYGTAKRDRVVLAEAQLYNNNSEEIKIISELQKVKMSYKIITGEEPVDLEMPNVVNIKLPAKNKNEFIDIVLSSNSELKQIEKQYESQKYARLGYLNVLPDIFVNYSFIKMNNSIYNINSHYFGIGASWSINGQNKPILQSISLYKNYRIAELNQILKTKELEQDAGYYWDQYFAMLELVNSTKKALKASTDSLEEIKISSSIGTATFVDEIDIETQYLNANLNYLQAQKALIMSYYKLISMVGTGKIVAE